LRDELFNLDPQAPDSEMLDNLRRAIVDYYLKEANLRNGLIADRTQPGSPSSIAALGMGLSVYIVAVERNILPRADAVDRTLALLRFLHSSHQGPEPNATGYKGFYYHFLYLPCCSKDAPMFRTVEDVTNPIGRCELSRPV